MKGKPLFTIAVIMSLLWVRFSGIYNYKGEDQYFLGINVFPFILWVVGLLVLRAIYEMQDGKDALLLTIAFYWIALLIIEYIGYNIMGIQLDSNYQGLLGLNALHVPVYAKIYYLTAGPVYLFITDYFGGKNAGT